MWFPPSNMHFRCAQPERGTDFPLQEHTLAFTYPTLAYTLHVNPKPWIGGFHWAGSLSRLVIHDPLGHTQAPDDL